MKYTNLAWAIIWSILAVMSAVAIFWNPAHFFSLIISIVFASIFWGDYKQTKDM